VLETKVSGGEEGAPAQEGRNEKKESKQISSKRLCIQDENGKMFLLQIEAKEADELFGLKVEESCFDRKSAGEEEEEGERRRRRRKSKSAKELREDVEGYDPTTGEVLGPEGQPIGPGNGSVVIREINSEKDINQAWFTTKEDKSALSDKGLNWKQGTWSSQEIALLNSNISNYCALRGIEDPVEIIFDMSKDERKDFYRCVSRGLQRPLFSVYRRVIRMYDAKNHIGKYTEDEVEKLKLLREELGSDWAKIGAAMGRSAASVKDRCRLLKDDCKSGKWEEDEEQRLTDAVHEVTETEAGTSVTSNVPWSQVAAMVNTRSEKQCRTKWLNYLNWKQAGGNRDWTRRDEILLLTKIAKLGDVEESTIDWISMSDGWATVRSPQWLRTKWLTLRRTLPQYQMLTLSEACKMLLEDVSRCTTPASRVLNRNASSSRGDAAGAGVGATVRTTSSLLGNDFWGVGEDSNGAASTSDIVNGIATEPALPTLEASQGPSLIRPPTFSIHADLGSHLLIEGSGLHIPAGASLSGGGVVGGETLHLALGNGSETFHLSSADGIVSSTAIDVELPPTTAFPAFANVCINPVVEDGNDGARSELTSPARDSPISRDVILTADRDSRSPFLPPPPPPPDEVIVAPTSISARSTVVASEVDGRADGCLDEDAYIVTPSGHLIPFTASKLEPSSSSSSSSSQRHQMARHHLVVGNDLIGNELISDVAVVQEGAEYEVECVEDDFIQFGDSALISDSNFVVVDGAVTANRALNDGAVTATRDLTSTDGEG